MRNAPELVEVDSTRLEEVLRRVEQSLDEKDSALVRAVFESYAYVADLVDDKDTSIRRLRQLFFGARTETTEAVVGPKTRKPDAAVPRGSMSRTRRSPRATRVPPVVRAPSTTRPRACSCGSPGSRRWRRRSTSCKNCAAIGAARSSPQPRPKRPAGGNTMPRPAA